MKKVLVRVMVLTLVIMALHAVSAAQASVSFSDPAAMAQEFGITPLELVDDPAIFKLTDSIGPNGEKGVGITELLKIFQPGDKEKIQTMNLTGAICMHTSASDFATQQIEGIRSVYDAFGIRLVAQTDGEFKVEKTVSDFESTLALKPDIMVHYVLDVNASLPLLQKAAEQGCIVALMDSIPEGISPDHFAGAAMADNYANGYYGAKYLAEAMGGKGQVAMISFIQDLFHTNQRSIGARDAFAEYPNIEIVEEQKHDGTTENNAAIADSFVIKYPDLKGIWTVWDMPGMAAAGIVENAGKQDQIKIASVDLAKDIGMNIASGGSVICLGAQHPFDQGVAEALLAIAKKLGYDTPKYVMVPGELITKGTYESFSAGWERVDHHPLPDEFKEVYGK